MSYRYAEHTLSSLPIFVLWPSSINAFISTLHPIHVLVCDLMDIKSYHTYFLRLGMLI